MAIRGMQRKINQIEETLVDKNDDLFAFLRSIVAEIEENREKVILFLSLQEFQCVQASFFDSAWLANALQ